MPMVGDLIKRHPRLPSLFAEAMIGKVVEVVKSRTLGPAFEHPLLVRHGQSLRRVAEWVYHFLVGDIMTMPERGTIMVAIAQVALVDSLTQVGINVHELSAREYEEYIGVIDISRPLVHAELVDVVKKDYRFREHLDSLLGIPQDWKKILQKAEDVVCHVDKQTQVYREARKARSWLRRLL